MPAKKKIYLTLIFLLCLAILIFSLLSNKPKKERPLQIVMLDIGQGDAIYIETPGNKNMLIDAGRDRQVLYELGNYAKDRINYIENSNPDLDHIGGFPFVMDTYKIGTIISAGTNHESLDAFQIIEKKAQEKKIPIIKPKQGSKIILDREYGVTYTILWPEGNVREWAANDGSMIGLLEYAGRKVLLTGDAPKEVEDQIVAKYRDRLQNLDILKVGHHGSKTSTGESLLAASTPEFAIISAGKNNRYGHPAKEVILLLEKYHTQTLVTIDSGTIVCKIWQNKETECK